MKRTVYVVMKDNRTKIKLTTNPTAGEWDETCHVWEVVCNDPRFFNILNGMEKPEGK